MLTLCANSSPKDNDALELINTSEFILISSLNSHVSYYVGDDIYTDYLFEVDQNIKGEIRTSFTLTFKGGTLNGVHHHYCNHPRFENSMYLLFLNLKSESYNLEHYSTMHSNGCNFLLSHIKNALNKNIDPYLTNHSRQKSIKQISSSYASTNNLIKNGRNKPTRWTMSDQGKSIGYYLDLDYIPQGYQKDEIRELVRSSFDEWAAVTNLKFKYLEDISLNGSVMSLTDEIREIIAKPYGHLSSTLSRYENCIVLQLHSTYEDDYDRTLGTAYFASYPNKVDSDRYLDYGYGGVIDGIEYDETQFGWCVFNHELFGKNTSAYDLKATIVHEIGHVLGLHHSSEDSYESDDVLLNSVMYYSGTPNKIWNDYLNIWDISNIQQLNPSNLYLPYSFNRNLDYYGFSNGVHDVNSGINKHDLFIFDLDEGDLEVIDLGSSFNPSNFSYNFDGNEVFISAEPAIIPDQDYRTTSYWSNRFFRIKDGENFSPVYELKVKNLLYDSNQNGISDTWENYYNLPLSETRNSDYDNDGISNYEEYLIGSNPSSFSNIQNYLGQNEFSFKAKVGDLYLLKNSTDLTTFTLSNDIRLEISSGEDIDGDGKLDIINEDLNSNGILDSDEDIDGDGKLDIINEDINNNGILDTPEPFVDSNNNGIRDSAEPYIDSDGNGYYTAPEFYFDSNNNGQWDAGDIFIDHNNNGSIDSAELYFDSNNNGRRDAGELYYDSNFNGEYDPADIFIDLNNNGSIDSAEFYFDSNNNGQWDAGDIFIDQNNNGIRDDAESFTDRNNNGIWDNISEDLDNDGNLDIFEDLNNNGILDIINEDQDNDGNLDVAEDLDGDNLLDASLYFKIDDFTENNKFYQIQIFD